MSGGFGSRPFDGEGSPSKKTVVIEKGILKSFLHDYTTAVNHGIENTGNAFRSSFSSTPAIYISNLILNSEFNTNELIEDTKKGIIVNDIMGSSSSRFAAGKFGFEAKNAFFIENGEIKYPITDVSIVGTLDEMLSTVEPGNDMKQEGLLVVPSIRVLGSVSVF